MYSAKVNTQLECGVRYLAGMSDSPLVTHTTNVCIPHNQQRSKCSIGDVQIGPVLGKGEVQQEFHSL